MKKVLMALVVLAMTVTTAMAAPEITSIGMKAYSTASGPNPVVSCTVIGGVQGDKGFIPKLAATETYSLGKGGTQTYTVATSLTAKGGNAVRVLCSNATTGASVTTKIFWNGSQAKFINLPDVLFSVAR